MPGILDVFNGDAFTVESLTAVINRLPYTPTRIGDLGLFQAEGVSTTYVIVEGANGVLTLVPAVPRGSPPQPKGVQKGRAQPIMVPHLPQRGKIMADEVQNVRVLGSDSNVAGAEAKMTALQAIMRRDLDYTIEFHRLGAIKGLVLNADGSTLIDMYATFGMTQVVQVIALGTDATKTLAKTAGIISAVEDGLGGTTYDHIHVLCSADFYQGLLGNAGFLQSLQYQQGSTSDPMRTDTRYKGITWGGVTWEQYRGAKSLGGAQVPNIEAGAAYAFPVGVPGMFLTRYAPADYMETVNTIGLPYYTKQEPMEMNKGVNVESQSNCLNINTRPEAVVKLTLT